MADELEGPSNDEQHRGVNPEPVQEQAGDEHRDGDQDKRDAAGVAEAIDWMLMASCVLCHPLLAGQAPKHARESYTVIRAPQNTVCMVVGSCQQPSQPRRSCV